ncbi:hypothetical protein RHMOL_Rhmol09G0176900 [Rhododendron molle]|uniref:Uncharacterized protein n=1 Tax=Rhododendron molle TaxID=49168 RepID=A0ACC0MG77_RHOML|nr:hypothetical protein RHMOL_Rhmol09G0176900 [Rhododendron molle]
MGNTESNKTNAAGSSEEDSARRERENAATAVGAATAVAAGKLLSSSASEDEKTNERGKMMEAAGSSGGGYQTRNKFEDSPPNDYYPDHEKTNEAAGRFESHQIPSIKFEDFPSDSVVLEGAAGNRIPGKLILWRFLGVPIRRVKWVVPCTFNSVLRAGLSTVFIQIVSCRAMPSVNCVL